VHQVLARCAVVERLEFAQRNGLSIERKNPWKNSNEAFHSCTKQIEDTAGIASAEEDVAALEEERLQLYQGDASILDAAQYRQLEAELAANQQKLDAVRQRIPVELLERFDVQDKKIDKLKELLVIHMSSAAKAKDTAAAEAALLKTRFTTSVVSSRSRRMRWLRRRAPRPRRKATGATLATTVFCTKALYKTGGQSRAWTLMLTRPSKARRSRRQAVWRQVQPALRQPRHRATVYI